ncbi:hypothetical protein CVU75_00940 [Candidatus Dependentiae bacterium HGW-Dependentiae-1]|nr:MAG: hypothetical protein CVU75_00940 [Candidatus Dependentiae bacterium HGW-Dependentiae-1]
MQIRFSPIKEKIFIALISSVCISSGYVPQKISIFAYPLQQQANPSYQRRGPASVILSLTSGLEQLKIPFNVNPTTEAETGDVVIVLSDVNRLGQAISLKKQHKIKLLLAGPNLMIRPNEYGHIATAPEIDAYFTPSLWVKVAYAEDEPSMTSRLVIWPAGVDENYWKPLAPKDPKKNRAVLVYQKTENHSVVNAVHGLLQKHGFSAIDLGYGNYSIEQYKKALEKCLFAVCIGNSESQGLAFAEAWAMNVPTLVYDLRKYAASGKTFTINSFCPYLTQKTGVDWRNFDELEGWLKAMPLCFDEFAPRAWVLKNMTDAVCAQKIIDLIARF